MAAGVVVVGLAIYFAGDTTRGFGKKTHTGTDGDVKYIVLVPGDYTADHLFPVILFLHGAAEGGTDGKKPAVVGLGKAIRDKHEKFPFIAVFPQSQTGGWEADGVEGKRAMAILDEVQNDDQTDKKRVYLTGLSLEAAGT